MKCTGGINAGVIAALAIGAMLLFGISACTEPLEEVGIQSNEKGGGETPSMLSWTPPTQYEDGSPLDPATEIRSYEIFVSPSPTPSEGDVPAAVVVGGSIDHYDLQNTGWYPDQNGLWVWMRSVSVEGVKSDFSATIAWR
jgi:hypothetical protein